MLTPDQFLPTVEATLTTERQRGVAADAQQEACILHPLDSPLQIVAGPGSGKTTVLVLRALRAVFVDGILPEQILLTTFTRKAAEEIRSRLVDWGTRLLVHLESHGNPETITFIRHVDINRFLTGTLDSICEEVLRDYRVPQDPPLVVLEGLASTTFLRRKGLTGTVYVSNSGVVPEVRQHLDSLAMDHRSLTALTQSLRPFIDRFSHDQVDAEAYANLDEHPRSRALIVEAYRRYLDHMKEGARLDFALLEDTFLKQLKSGKIDRFAKSLKVLFVDEYQDTNLLQERIYFELARRSGASLTVVGDDDQSIYRFRGASVELFRDFAPRVGSALPSNPRAVRLDLTNNYRSTPEIVTFFNSFITHDPGFTGARVTPPKPQIEARQMSLDVPILGLFRSDLPSLARDLTGLLLQVFHGTGIPLPSGNLLRGDPDQGDLGDAVFLASSVRERGSNAKERLPLLLREELRLHGLQVFNPRGENLRDVPDVRALLGAMLTCLAPDPTTESDLRLTRVAQDALGSFRQAYLAYVATKPEPNNPHGLADFVYRWGGRQAPGARAWPKEWPALELLFKLLAWFPRLRDDPEGQIHLEAITRAITTAAAFSAYSGQILHGNPDHASRSVQAIIRDILAPLATGDIDVDEEIMPAIPRDRLPMMTIHQSKGLEFPLVILDVGSDFQTAHHFQAFRRYPSRASTVALVEDDLATVSEVGPLRQARTALDRTFDDLMRLYYVAFSRPQVALVLVGLTSVLETPIPNMATFWQRPSGGAKVGPWSWVPDALPLTRI